MLKKVKGIVIRRVEYGDAHLIVTFLSEYGHKETVMARNAKKSRKFGSSLDLFYENLFIFSQFKGMGTLSSVDTIESHYDLRADLRKLIYAQYIAELIDKALEEDEVNQFLYELLQFGLNKITEGITPDVIAMIVSLKMMPIYGYTANFKYCEVDQINDPAQFIGYSIKYNSVMTKKSWSLDERTIQISNKSLYFLYLLQQVPIDQFNSLDIDSSIIAEMEQLLFLLYDEFIGVYLKSRKILQQLK